MQTLKCIAVVDCSVGFTAPLRAEWKKHQSSYARKWLLNMIARRRFKFERDTEWHEQVEEAADEQLGTAQAAAVRKDSHLVAAAIAFSQRVISLDDKLRTLLSTLKTHVPDLQNIAYVVPDRQDAAEWITNGAPLLGDAML